MSFSFHCPEGHLLQAEPAHAGQQSQCPYCQSMFVIPSPDGSAPVEPAPPTMPAAPPLAAPPTAAPPADFGPPVAAPPAATTPYLGQPVATPDVNDPISAMAAAGGGGRVGGSPQDPVESPKEPRLFHIPCPNGHELETPEDMLNEDVVCPHCYTQFQAREKDSIEYKKRKEREREIREMKTGKMWLWIAGIVGVAAILLLVALMVLRANS